MNLDLRPGHHAIRSSWRSSSRCSRPTGRTPATTPRPTSPRRRSGPASPVRGASSCRSRSARSSGSSSCSRCRPTCPTCRRCSRPPLDDSTLPTASQYYFGGGVAVIAILQLQPRTEIGDLLAAGIAIAMAFCGLSSVASAGRMLYRVQPRRRPARLRLAQEGLASLPDAGQLADGDRRRWPGCSRSRRSSSAAARPSSSSRPSARSSCTPRTGSASTSVRRPRTGSRSGSGAWAAGPSRSPGSRSPGSSS